MEHPSLAITGGKKHFLNDLAERVYVPDKTSLKINGAENEQRQSFKGVPN
jgi:hypothetical protein